MPTSEKDPVEESWTDGYFPSAVSPCLLNLKQPRMCAWMLVDGRMYNYLGSWAVKKRILGYATQRTS